MAECSICERNSACLGGTFRQVDGRWLCPACWDGLALGALALADGPQSVEQAVAAALIQRVAHRARTGAPG
jgi:hypothetical protein